MENTALHNWISGASTVRWFHVKSKSSRLTFYSQWSNMLDWLFINGSFHPFTAERSKTQTGDQEESCPGEESPKSLPKTFGFYHFRYILFDLFRVLVCVVLCDSDSVLMYQEVKVLKLQRESAHFQNKMSFTLNKINTTEMYKWFTLWPQGSVLFCGSGIEELCSAGKSLTACTQRLQRQTYSLLIFCMNTSRVPNHVWLNVPGGHVWA